MTRKLPPIFAKARFTMPPASLPSVIFVMSKDMDDEAGVIVERLDRQDVQIEHFGRWWVEYDHTAILATLTSEREHTLMAWGKRSGRQKPFVLHDDDLHADTYARFDDMQKLVAAIYMRAAVLLASYTAATADVSVLTGMRKSPAAWEREGDTLRYAPVTDIRSVSGLTRPYERPAEPSGIRMREHDVRGHWRTFPSGVRVWVRPHKRGDADLGRVTRVIA